MKTRSFCETPMSLVMSNSKDGQGHSDKYLDTNKKISSQEMLTCDIYHFVMTDSLTFF